MKTPEIGFRAMAWALWLVLFDLGANVAHGQALVSQALVGQAQARPVSSTLEQETVHRLSADAGLRWHRLLHMQDTVRGLRGTIDYPSFYFSEIGKHNAAAELEASRLAIRTGKPKVGPLKLDPICAFPARGRFFQEIFGDQLRKVHCPEVALWRQSLKLKSVSMVFSAAYPGNPASMLGHTFLKLNAQTPSGKQNPLLSYSASFMAMPDDDWSLVYFAKGVTGGYMGAFSLDPFYTHVMSYAYGENRDLWEYEFPLSSEEGAVLVEHLWELVYSGFTDYYFLDDNCSSLLLEVLDVVRPKANLAAGKGLFALPHQAIRQAARRFGDHKIHFYPSQRKEFVGLAANLSGGQSLKLQELIASQSSIPETEDAQVLNALLAYLNFRKATLDRPDQGPVRQMEDKALRRRAELGALAKQSEPIYLRSNRPDRGHAQSKASLGLFWQETPPVGGDRLSLALRYRYGLHDLMDPPAGYEPYYHLNFFDALVKIGPKQGLENYRLTILEVASLSPVNRFFSKLSWKAGGGVRSVDAEGCRRCFSAFAEGGVGTGYEVLPQRLLLYSMPSLSVDLLPNQLEESRITADASASALYYLSDQTRVQMSVGTEWQWQSGGRISRPLPYAALKHQWEPTEGSLIYLEGRIAADGQSSASGGGGIFF